MDDALIERVETLERAVTDGDHDFSTLTAEADALERLDSLEEQLKELEEHTAELEAATQALRGYVGSVRAVNEDVENRADTALAKVERLEAELATEQSETATSNPSEKTPANQETHSVQRESWSENLDRTTQRRTERSTSQMDEGDYSQRAEGTQLREPLSADGGVTEQPSTARTRNEGSPEGDSTAHSHHCEACGHRQPVSTETAESAFHPGTSESNAFDSLGEDPLLKEPDEDNGSPLDRFRNLL